MDPLVLLLIGVTIVIGAIVWLRLHAFIALLAAAIVVSALTPRDAIERAVLAQNRPAAEATARAQERLGAKLAHKFGNTSASLGILIAMASIVGVCLLHSGGAERIVRSMLRLFGEKRSPFVFASSGLILGVPVFFDTVFLLLIPLARALGTRTGRNYLLYVLAIAVGTTMTHSLVPPTPGPLFVANALQVDLGLMMIAGLLLSTFAAAFGLSYAWWANSRWPIPVRSLSGGSAPAPTAERPDHELPPLWLALAPIILPVVLISGSTLMDILKFDPAVTSVVRSIGHPNIALSIAAVIGLIMIATRPGVDRGKLRETVQAALADAGTIILITAAGGVFGGVLQETGVGERIQGLARTYQIGVLPLAYAITALIRVAQGSATVAMVTGVGILGAVASSTSLGYHPVYLALAIGCGSKMMPWMNDSGFWVVCNTSGLTERETLRTLSVMFSIMSVVGFCAVMLGATFFPLV